MNAAKLILRCYVAKEKDKDWYAVCIDLNLIASGDNSNQAKNKLHKMIVDYVYEAFTVDSKYFDQLIPRKAPFYFQVRYYYISFLYHLRNFIHYTKAQLYTEHLPLVPQINGR